MGQNKQGLDEQGAMPFHQLLTAEGERIPDALLDGFVADVTDATLHKLLQDMMVMRRIDVEATALQRQGELALWPPLLGQEAAQAGSAFALDPADFVFSTYRESGVAYLRGAGPAELMSVWRGNNNSGWDPYTLNMATPQIVIGAQTLHAAGYGMGIALDGGGSLAIAYFGDGATSQGDVHEAMVFAASFQSPVVFFCQNNHWAISEPVGLQSSQPLAARGTGYGIPSLLVDGNDVLAVLAATRWAAERARTGGGPSFIEALTYRMGPHTTADDPTRYRGVTELDDWAAKDPIARLRSHLLSRNMLDAGTEAAMAAAADAVATGLRQACTTMPEPEPLSVFDHVYVDGHPLLDRQRIAYELYMGQFAEGAASGRSGS